MGLGSDTTTQDPSEDRVDFRGHMAPVRPEDILTAEPPGGTERSSDGIQMIPIILKGG